MGGNKKEASKKRSKSIKKIAFYLIVLFAASSFSFGQDYSAEAKVSIPVGKGDQGYTVSRVIDGDTFKLSNGQTLKLAGINAPEIHDTTKLTQEAKKFGKEIWAYRTAGGDAQKLIQRLIDASDNQIEPETETQSFDESGNLIAYVFVRIPDSNRNAIPEIGGVESINGSVNIFLNAYLVGMGFAEVVSPEAKYQDLFSQLEKEAKENKRGIWG